jgi:hypothetical protein
MPQGLQALLVLLVLLPGFVSATITNLLSARGKSSELEKIIEALIFSFFTYVVYISVFGVRLPVEWSAVVDSTGQLHYTGNVYRLRIGLLAVIALTLGFGWGWIRSKDWLMALLRKWKISERTSRETVWNDVFYTLGGTVQVGFEDGRNLVGWVVRYSDSGGERSLFLEKAAWIDDQNVRTEIPGAGVLVTEAAKMEFVMFLDPPDAK